MLLDEPTSQLDPVAGDELIGLLRRLNQEWETTILLAEHRLERCLSAADRVIALTDGRVACDGDPRRSWSGPASARPALQTPGARSCSRRAGLQPAPARRQAGPGDAAPRTACCVDEQPPPEQRSDSSPRARRQTQRRACRPPRSSCAASGTSCATDRRSCAASRCSLQPGESVALMGRNGAGKSTLLRHAAGLLEPTRGRVQRAGRVALLLQNPGDYFIHERVGEEASAEALAAVGLADMAERNPRDLSGGERQRLALAIVTGGGRDAGGARARRAHARDGPRGQGRAGGGAAQRVPREGRR